MEDGLLRNVGSSEVVHENLAPTDWHSQVTGHSMLDIHRRLASPRPGSFTTGEGNGNSNGVVTSSGGTSAKIVEGESLPLPSIYLPRNYLGHHETILSHPGQAHQSSPGDCSKTSEDISTYGKRKHGKISTYTRSRAICGASGVDLSGDSSSEEATFIHPARAVEGRAEEGLEWPSVPVTKRTKSVGVVDIRGAMESKWKRHLTSGQGDTAQPSHRRRDAQRGIRWRDDSGTASFPDERVSDRTGTKGSVHQPVRVCRFRKLPVGSAPASGSEETGLEEHPHISRARQRHKHQVRQGGSVSVDKDVSLGSEVFRQGRGSGDISHVSTFSRRGQHGRGRVVSASQLTRGLAAGPTGVSSAAAGFSGVAGRGLICKFQKQAGCQLFHLPLRSSSSGCRRIPAQLVEPRSPVCLPSPHTAGKGTPKVNCRLLPLFNRSSASVDGADVVSDDAIDDDDTPNPSPEPSVVGDGSAGSSSLAEEVASRRVLFIWRHGARQGISKDVFKKRWEDAKNGYPTRYDAHFESFLVWWYSACPTTECSPSTIRPGLLAQYLTEQAKKGIHHDILRDISTSISMACVEASDQAFQPGKSYTVSKLFEGERRHKPTRRAGTGEYSDVSLLYEEMWKYGPSTAMTVGQKKKRIVSLLAADSAARPSDIARLFRVFDGWQQQIVFTSWGVKIRFFYTKEIVPGSSRSNSTGYWFTSWVSIYKTEPAEISTPELLKDYLDSTSGSEYATQHISELDSNVQPLVFARKRLNQWQPSSVDHISKLVTESLQEAGMEAMTMKSVRGASPSKLVQIFPDMEPQAIALGRWTEPKTFRNHYQAPVKLESLEAPPAAMKVNVQQILRWGFQPRPPPNVSAEEYMQGPGYWVGQTFGSALNILSFDEGIYSTAVAGVFPPVAGSRVELYHYELMEAVSRART